MIKVERPELPDVIKKLMETERLAAEAYHTPFDEKKPAFAFKAYKNKKLAELLETAFHKKCGYCESSMRAVQPQDIEHYRPKQAVIDDGKLKKPGYYWLASHWPNLLSSCIYCNRPNRHKIGSKAAAKALGKGNEFPLENPEDRVKFHSADITKERPLILDPCGSEDPDKHLQFFCDGWISARKDDAGLPSLKGSTTIDVLALQRPGLVKERLDRAKLIIGDLVLYETLECEVSQGQGSRLSLALATLRIDQHLQIDQPYVGMARQIIEERKPGLIAMLPKISKSVAAEVEKAKKILAVPAHPD